MGLLQDGPFHHMLWSLSSTGDMPLEAQSAGFCAVGTCLHALGGMRLVMDDAITDIGVVSLGRAI